MKKKTLWNDLKVEYLRLHPRSQKLYSTTCRDLVGGGSHNLRMYDPFPFFDESASGAKINDIDGNTYIDFWQGHFGNVLGHNPPIVLSALKQYFESGQGLQTGFPGLYQHKLARIILDRSGLDNIRFTTSGTLATMYAVMLSTSFTKRNVVLKIGGGWHGAQPYTLKGISHYRNGLNQIESAGLPSGLADTIVTTRFNDPEDLEAKFTAFGDRIACLIMEPFVGAGGFIFGDHEYLQRARELTSQYGVVLIFDEVVSGFRFHAGPLFLLYAIQPDLVVFGKAIGGGMPVSAVAGREELMQLCHRDTSAENRVKFEGGTFSAHPASMLAGYTFLKHLIAQEKQIYPRIGEMGSLIRQQIPKIFERHGFYVKSTGAYPEYIPNSSIVGIHFLTPGRRTPKSSEEVWDPKINDFELREKYFRLAMLNRGINVFHGFGAISFAHSDEDLQTALDATEEIALKWQDY